MKNLLEILPFQCPRLLHVLFQLTFPSFACEGCGNSQNYENRDLERQKYGERIQRHNNLERPNLNYSFQQHSASNKYVTERQESLSKPFPQFQDQQTSTRSLTTYQNENEILKRPEPTRPNKQGRSLLNKAAIMKHIHPNCNTDKVLKIAKILKMSPKRLTRNSFVE